MLPKFCLGSEYVMKADTAYTFSGGIRTYLYLLHRLVHVVKLDGTTCYIKKVCVCFTLYQRMEEREWMYTGHPSMEGMTPEWRSKTNDFLELVFAGKSQFVEFGAHARSVITRLKEIRLL